MPFDYNQFAAKKPQENANGVQPVDYSSNLDNVFAEAEAELQNTNNSDTQVPKIDAPDKDGYQLMQDGFREQELKLASGFNFLNRAAASVPEGITRAASVITNPVAKLFGIPEYEPNTLSKTIGLDKVDNYLVSERDKYQKEIKQINPYTELGVVNAIKENNYKAAFRNLAGGVLESLPASVALMTLPIAEVGVPGQIGFSTALFGSGKLKELDEVAPDLPEEAKVINATVNGALEGIFETLFGSGAIGSSLDNILKKEGLKQGEKIIGNGVRQVFSDLLTKYPALSPFGEMYEEMATQVTQNITDKLTGVDPEKPVTEGMWDAGILGLTSGGLHGGMIAGTKAIANRLNKHIEKKQARANIEANLNPITNAKTGNVHAVKLRGQEKAEDEVYFVVDVDDDGFANIVDRQGNKVLDSEGKPYQNIQDFTTENVLSREQILQGELQSLTQEQAAKEQAEAQAEREKNELAQIPEQLTIPNENGKEQKYVFAGEVRRNNPEKPNEITDFEVGLVDEFGEMPYDIAFLPAKTVYDYIGSQNESNEKELDQVLTDAEKEVSTQKESENEKNATTIPNGDSNVSGKPVVQQPLGNTTIDVIENEDHDEIVPSEKMPLEKALPLLEKKFKDNPKYEVVAEKERVEIPGRVIKGETKWDEDVVEPSTFKTVIKSVKIYPKEVLEQKRKEEQESKSFYQEQKKAVLVDAVSKFNATPDTRSDKQKASEIEALATKLGYMTDRSPMNEIRIFNNKEGYVNIPKTAQPEQSGQINQLQTNKNISNPDKLTTFKPEQQVNTQETTQPKATKPPTPKQIERAKLLKSEPNSAREVILKYFLSGGKVSPEMINRESIGRDRTGKLRSEGERRSMFWVTKQGEAKYTDQLEHILHGTPWENMLDDPTDFSNEVLDVLSLGTPSNMMAELKRLQSEQGSFDQQYSPEQISEIETLAAQQAESERLDYEEQLQSVFEELFENQNISEQEIVNLFYTNNEENGNDQNEGRSGQASTENSTTTGDNPTGSIEADRGNDTGEESQDAEVKTDLSLKQKKQLVISRYGGMYEDVANATPEEIYNTIPEVDYTEAKQIHAEIKSEFDTASKPELDYHEEIYEDQRNVNPEDYGHRLLTREERKNLPVWKNGKMIDGPDYRIDDFEIGDTVINNYNGQALKIDRIEKNKKGEPVDFVLKDIKDGTEYKERVENGRGIYQDLQIKETPENDNDERLTETKSEKPVNQIKTNISESESLPKNETSDNKNVDFFTEIQQNIPTNDKIKSLEEKLARQKKLREQKVKNMNERNGLFGDAQADPRQIDLFAETFAPTQENFQKAIDKVNAEINSIQKEIDQERRVLLTAARENKGQLEIISNEESKVDTNPTEAQKEAGNYKKGHVTIQGLDITIENPKGSIRSGVDKTGKPWSVTMNNTYGYFKRTVGKDGDHVDVFLGDKPLSDKVFVIDQNNEDGNFDESKVMLGFDSAEQAQSDYMKNYSPGWKGFRAITESSIDDFKEWLNDGARQNKAYSEYKQNQSVEANEKVEEVANKNKEAINRLNSTLSQYGWTTKQNGNKIALINRNNKVVAYISGTDNKYSITDIDGKKLLNGNNGIENGAEKVAIEYFYAKKDKNKPSSNTIFTEDAKNAALERIRKRRGNLNAGINPEDMLDMITIAGYHIEAGSRKFVDFANNMIGDLGEWVKPYLKGLYENIRRYPGMETVAKEMDTTQAVDGYSFEEKPVADTKQALIDSIKQRISDNEWISSTPRLTALANNAGFVQGKDYTDVKELYDIASFALNEYLSDNAEQFNQQGKTAEQVKEIVKILNEKMNLLPTETTRSADQVEKQQFSTPPAFAFVANWAAQVNQNDTVLEPSAGEGNIAVFAKNSGANVVVNEIDKKRSSLLSKLFSRVLNEDAKHLHAIAALKSTPVTTVVMNPPFSRDIAMGNKLDIHAAEKHMEAALYKLEDGGRLVAIVGRGMSMDSPTHQAWFHKVAEKYNIKANILVSGDAYSKKGTNFDNRLIIIDNNGETYYKEVLTGEVKDYSELVDLVSKVSDKQKLNYNEINNRTSSTRETSRPTDTSVQNRQQPGTANDVSSRRSERSNAGQAEIGGLFNQPVDATNTGSGSVSGNKPATSRTTSTAEKRGIDERIPDTATTSRSVEPETRQLPDTKIGELKVSRQEKKLNDSGNVGYDQYVPEITIEGSKPHPTKLVESTAMASVSLPEVDYTPQLPVDKINEGALSDAQLEDVILAGNSHKQVLPDGKRRGFFLGAGTGYGKGRTIAAIILDNYNQGRKKAVWISKNDKAHYDSADYWEAVGGDPKVMFEQKSGTVPIAPKEGVLLSKYGTLSNKFDKRKDYSRDDTFWTEKPQNRLQQMAQWLGKDFDGVIVFDESHKMANAKDTKGARGSKKASSMALAGLELQRLLPNARVVYSSATGATEVTNLVYAQRLGLWGDGTPFSQPSDFIQAVENSGVAGMELISRDLKAMGLYTAKTLSFDGVQYDTVTHNLMPEQKKLYDKVARAWQKVLENINDAIEENNTGKNAKSAAMSAFWGAHQRFFSNIIITMQMPSLLNDIQENLANDKAIVVQLVNTNEAATKRALAEAKSELEEGEEVDYDEMDVSPKQSLIEFLRRSFPVALFETTIDENGNEIQVMVRDSEGNPVENPTAVKRRDNLIAEIDREIQLPESPLDILINTFGAENVAEITGRSSRIVAKQDESGNYKKVEESRTNSSVAADKDAFMDGKKNILVFSDAGGTGASFHSDLKRKNQKQRVHYVLQAGWRADGAVQGFGRSHRSNQAVPPIFKLVTTNLKAQRRFLSSIARRLDQLGALTKGQRQTGGQGILDGSFNLEGEYAKQALFNFYVDVENGKVDGVDMNTLEKQMALKIYVEDDGGNRKYNDQVVFNTKMFLNRLMSLEVDLMDNVFEGFMSRLEEEINIAKTNGTYDEGIEVVKALSTKVVDEQEIYSDDKTGAKTYITTIELELPNEKTDFEAMATRVQRYGKKFKGFYREEKSGRIYAMVQQEVVRADGERQTKYRRFSVVTDTFIDPSDYYGKYQQVDEPIAREAWNTEFTEYPNTRKKTEYIVKGLILPIWNRLPSNINVKRYIDNEGNAHLGRSFSKKDIESIRSNFEVASSETYTADKLVDVLNKGGYVKLSNGFELAKKTHQGNTVFTIANANSYRDRERLTRAGASFVVKSSMSMSGDFVIPSANASEVLQSVIEMYNAPAIEVEDSEGNHVIGERTAKKAEPVNKPHDTNISIVRIGDQFAVEVKRNLDYKTEYEPIVKPLLAQHNGYWHKGLKKMVFNNNEDAENFRNELNNRIFGGQSTVNEPQATYKSQEAENLQDRTLEDNGNGPSTDNVQRQGNTPEYSNNGGYKGVKGQVYQELKNLILAHKVKIFDSATFNTLFNKLNTKKVTHLTSSPYNTFGNPFNIAYQIYNQLEDYNGENFNDPKELGFDDEPTKQEEQIPSYVKLPEGYEVVFDDELGQYYVKHETGKYDGYISRNGGETKREAIEYALYELNNKGRSLNESKTKYGKTNEKELTSASFSLKDEAETPSWESADSATESKNVSSNTIESNSQLLAGNKSNKDISENKIDPRGGIYNSDEYRLANKVQSILKERGINKGFSISDTFGYSIYFTVYGDNFEPKLKIRISDHSVSNKDRIFNEQHETKNSDADRIANNIELAMYPEHFNKIESGKRYWSKYDNTLVSEKDVDKETNTAWIKGDSQEWNEKQLSDAENNENIKITGKEFLRESKSGNKIYKVHFERKHSVDSEPTYRYERKETIQPNILQRKTSSIGFYSTVENALEQIKQEKGTPEQFKAMLLKNGAKQAEMDWMGFDDQFPDATKKVSKEKQFDIIQSTNPMRDDYHVGIRKFEDIKTFDQVVDDSESFVYGDFSKEDAQKAIKEGSVTVYSSAPIKNGAFVSTSENQAKDYAGNGKVYSQKVNLGDVAWINGDEGQMAKADNTITKTDIQNWIDQNKIDVEEVVKGTFKPEAVNENDVVSVRFKQFGSGSYVVSFKGDIGDIEISTSEAESEEEAIQAAIERANYDNTEYIKEKPKFSQYVEPGGEEYFELVLTMPGQIEPYKPDNIHFTEEGGGTAVVWVRAKTYKTDNEKILFLEEIQSKRGQDGKKEGFKRDKLPDNVKIKEVGGNWQVIVDGRLKGEYKTEQRAKETAMADFGGVPSMPFKKTDQWVNLSLRRMMRYAAENGFDRIAWTNGEQQAARYDLSKTIESVEYYNTSGRLIAYDKNGSSVINESGVDENKIEDYIGKEAAKKLFENITEERNGGRKYELKGEQLKVGGEGMKAFYDAIVPSAASKLGKPFGAKVENVVLSYDYKVPGIFNTKEKAQQFVDENKLEDVIINPEPRYNGFSIRNSDGSTIKGVKQPKATVQSLPVTDKMIESVSQGVPLFRNEYDTPMEAAERIVKAMNQRAEMVTGVADRLSNELNTPIIVVRNETMLPRNLQRQVKKQGAKRSVMGVYNPTDGKIYLVSNNIPSELETEKTILHEIVGHKGLRSLLGAKAHRKLMEMVWNSLTPVQKADLKNRLGNLNPLVLADEYMAELAEQNSTPKWYEKVLSKLREMLRKVFPNLRLNNAELKTIIRKSYEALKRPAPEQFDNPLDFAEALSKHVKNTNEPAALFRTAPQQKEEGSVLDKAAANIERKPSNVEVGKIWEEVRKAIQDRDLPVRRLIETIVKRGGKLNNDANAYRDISLAHGRAENLLKNFEKDLMQKVVDAVSAFKQNKGVTQEKITLYTIAKHAPERNAQIRKQRFEEWLKQNPQPEDPTKYTEWETEVNQYQEYLNTQDFSGILSQDVDEEFKGNPEGYANKLVKDFEAIVDRKQVNDYWKAVRGVNKFTLGRWLEGNQIDPDYYEQMVNGYKYYVPLKGWWDDAAKELDYHSGKGTGKSLHKAEGRKSLPDDPLAYMEHQAFKSISEQVDNEVKLSMLRFVMDNMKGNEDIINMKRVYYVQNPLTGEWDYTLEKPTPQQFADGSATMVQYRDHFKLRKPVNAQEHEVWVDTKYGTFAMVFPDKGLEVAQALNHQNNLVGGMDAEMFNKFLSGSSMLTIGWWTNIQKALYTSWNVTFPVKNMLRDMPEAASHLLVKYGPKQASDFSKELPLAMGTTKRYLYGKFSPQRDSRGNALNNDAHFEDFASIGGMTGFTHLKTPEEYQKELSDRVRKAAKKGVNIKEQLEKFSELFEDTTRFAAYKSGILNGMSKRDAAMLAKEVSVNFNRKGKLSKSFDAIFAFFNAALQAGQKNLKLAKDNPKAFMAVAAGWVVLGGLIAELNRMFDDDDEEYERLNSFVRMNYLVFPIGNGEYFRMPLPQFFRGFYGMGANISDLAHGKTDFFKAMGDGLLNFANALTPIELSAFFDADSPWYSSLVPTVFKPMSEIAENKDFMNYPIYKEAFTKDLEGKLANSGMHKNNVNTAYKFVTDALFRAGGGDSKYKTYYDKETGQLKEVNWALDWNPSKIEYFIKTYTGGTGAFINDFANTLMQVSTTGTVEQDNIPFINSFVRNYPEKTITVIGEYYDMKKDVDKFKSIFNEYKKDPSKSETIDDMLNNKKYWEQASKVKKIDKQFDYLKNQFENGNMTIDEYIAKRASIIESELKTK